MNKFENGKIYKIVDDSNNNIYIGSTIQKYISTRLSGHRMSYKKYIETNKQYMTSFEILKNNNYHMELIELYPCKNSISLRTRERYWIDQLECVNKQMPVRTDEELKEYGREYRVTNKEKIKQTYKEYYIANKESISEKSREYRKTHKEEKKKMDKLYSINNKEKIKQTQKEYYIANKEKIKQTSKLHYENNKDKNKEREKEIRDYKKTWGGDYRCHNNLLRIDVTLFE